MWRSNRLINQVDVAGVCSGVVAFNMSANEGAMAAVAVAVDNSVLIYKNMKPYFKVSHSVTSRLVFGWCSVGSAFRV